MSARSPRFQVREYAKDGRHGWRIYDTVTLTWGGKLYRHKSTAAQYVEHLTANRREIISAWIIGTNGPGEIRGNDRGGFRYRTQHEKPEVVK